MRHSFIKVLLLVAVALSPLQNAYSQASTAAGQITEFDVNGMKVLIKRRPGTPTVAAALFFKGGVRNLTADNAGLESFTLSVAAEGSKSYPRPRLRKETYEAEL